MEAMLLLANATEITAGGLLNVYGLGWLAIVTPTDPAVLIASVKVPWHETNQRHTFTFNLIDEDGRDVRLWQSPAGRPTALNLEGSFEVARPYDAPPGTELEQLITMNVPGGMRLHEGVSYQWRMRIDGRDVAARTFHTH